MKILVIDNVHPVFYQSLPQHAICIDATKLSNDAIQPLLHDVQVIVIRSRLAIDKAFIDAAPNLRVILRAGAGLESIDTDYAQAKGIACFNSPEGNRDAVAEHAMGMLLMLLHRLHLANASVKKGEWQRESFRGTELGGKRVGIIGYGHMGSTFAKKLSAFNCELLVYDKYKSPIADPFVRQVSLAELKQQSEIISLHVPLTAETTHYIDQNFIAECKHPFILLNLARGKCVQTKALLQGLESKKIKGACLDVNEYEDTSFNQGAWHHQLLPHWESLKQHDDVILTPHIGGWTVESFYKIAQVLASKLMEYQLVP
jgi:D-3-phosphoglycerate dehydrogenase / 2-oxoglutarate reductase